MTVPTALVSCRLRMKAEVTKFKITRIYSGDCLQHCCVICTCCCHAYFHIQHPQILVFALLPLCFEGISHLPPISIAQEKILHFTKDIRSIAASPHSCRRFWSGWWTFPPLPNCQESILRCRCGLPSHAPTVIELDSTCKSFSKLE